MLHPRAIAPRRFERQVQRVGDILGFHGRAKLPGDDVARIVVQDGRQVKPAPTDDLQISYRFYWSLPDPLQDPQRSPCESL